MPDVYISEDYEDVIGDNVWQNTFTEQPAPLTQEEKRAWLDKMTGVALGSDAFFRLATTLSVRTEAAFAILRSRAVRSATTM